MRKKIVYMAFIFLVITLFVIVEEEPSSKYIPKTNIDKNGLYGWPLVNMNAQEVVPYISDSLPIIGLIDSGIDLKNKYIPEINVMQIVVDKKSHFSLKEHGTMVAGLIIANGDGIKSPGGIIPKAKLVSIQSGTDAGMSKDQLAKAIDLLVKNGAQIINISHGSADSSPELERAVKNALTLGVIIVASAGNDGENKNNYPAKLDGVIAVSALKKDNTPASYTNLEPNNIFAPGEYLLTTGVGSDNYTWFNGSSAATPLVSSICSILKYYKPEWDSNTIKSVLLTYSNKELYNNQEINILNVRKVLDYMMSTNTLSFEDK